MLSRAGVRFVGRVVGCKCLVGDDGGYFDRGLPPRWFGWSVARAVARLLFALWRGWWSLALMRGCRVCLCLTFDGRWTVEACTFEIQKPSCVGLELCTAGISKDLCRLYWPECVGGSCYAIPREITDVFHQC